MPVRVIRIPKKEFNRRQRTVQQLMKERSLDGLLVHGNEAEFANVRYLSDYWPIFESAGVFIPADGNPILLIGPESETFARDHSVIPKIKKVLWYRESAEPDYPNIPLDTFEAVFSAANGGKGVGRLGIAGYTAMSASIYDAVRAALPKAKIVKADDLIYQMRMIKSPAEIAVLREAFRVSEKALAEVLQRIKPGMTELQIVGIAQEMFYRHGAEYEAHPTYVLSGKNSAHAIGRPTHRLIRKGDLVQLNIGARVAGYSPSIGVPICMGKMPAKMKDLISFGLEAHLKTMAWMKAGVPAGTVATNFFDFVKARGYEKNMLYGPCHGLGMIEVERPWMETSSTYPLQENMTFQVDTFLYCRQYGLRWESGVRVTQNGIEEFSKHFRRIIEIT